MELVETLKEIQKNNGYTDQEMAEKIGCSRPYYNQIRAGNVSMGPLLRLKVIQAFHNNISIYLDMLIILIFMNMSSFYSGFQAEGYKEK